jgi:molybdopterin converting factor small subunit
MILSIELSPALQAIYRQLPGTIRLEIKEEAITFAEALKLAGIQPLLVIKGVIGESFVELDQKVKEDCEIKLLSPLSGG